MAMQRTDRDRGTKGITSIVTLKVLGALTGHGREIATFDSYAIARNANRHRREAVGYLPTQEIASRRRERALTPPPFGRAVLHPSQLNEQTQSPLFKLPEEILLLIYEEVLGHNLFHIVKRSTRFQLGHVLCKANTPRRQEECNEHECRGMKVPSGVHPKTRPGNGGLIQLLRSCRRIYIDAVRILYLSNIFDFDCMETLISFSTDLVPARFDSIISLQLDFRFPLSVHFREATPQNDSDRWERTWRIIGSMKSLQFLYVRIAWPKSEMSVREERRFMEPLRQVKELKCFEVSLQPVIGTEFQRDKEQHWVVFRRTR